VLHLFVFSLPAPVHALVSPNRTFAGGTERKEPMARETGNGYFHGRETICYQLKRDIREGWFCFQEDELVPGVSKPGSQMQHSV